MFASIDEEPEGSFEEEEYEQLPQPDLTGATESIIYYKTHIQGLSKRISILRGKLAYLRKLQVQFSLLTNKTVEAFYGALVAPPPVQKPTIPPLPPIHRYDQTEVIRAFSTGRPSDIVRFLNESSVVPRLLFSRTSVFDDQLVQALTRAQPDVQVAFFTSIIKEVKRSGSFFEKMRPMIAQFTNDPALVSQIEESDANYLVFFDYYQKCMQNVADLIGCIGCKVVYCAKDEKHMIFPTENFNHVIDIDDSLCGILLKQKMAKTDSPKHNPAFEIVSEGPVFEEHEYVACAAFRTTKKASAGLVLLFKTEPFTERDVTHLKLVTKYLSPLLILFRSIFLRIAPAHFSTLSSAIAGLKGADNVIAKFKEQLQNICSAGLCRLMRTDENNDAGADLPVLSEERSLIRDCVNAKTTACYRKPRMRADFNRQVDDPNLPRITSMLIVPIEETNLVAVLYNSLVSSQFTSVQKLMAGYFSSALPPLIFQILAKRKMDVMNQEFEKEMVAVEKAIKLIAPIVEGLSDKKLFEVVSGALPSWIGCNLFLIQTEKEAIRFPDYAYVELTDQLVPPESGVTFSKSFDVAIDVRGDQEAKEVMIVKSKEKDSQAVCIFYTKKEDGFDEDMRRFLPRFGNILLFVTPMIYMSHLIETTGHKIHLLHESTKTTTASLSKLIDADVQCHFYDSPLHDEPDMDAPLLVSVETERGIEAVLTSNDTSETTKSVLISYAGWLSTALNTIEKKQVSNNILQVLIDFGACKIFKCTQEKLEKWLNELSKIITFKPAESYAFIGEVLSKDPWPAWFDEESRLAILISAMLRGIESKWSCKTGKVLVDRLRNCEPTSCACCAAVFAPGFGLVDNLDNDSIKHLVSLVDQFVVTATASCETSVLIHLRSVSMRAFKMAGDDQKWVGKAFALFPLFYVFYKDHDLAGQRLLEEYGEAGRKVELFKAERLYLPILSFISQRHENIAVITTAVRDGIAKAREASAPRRS